MAELPDSDSPRRPLTFIGEDQDRRTQAKRDLESALESYTKAVSRERELDLQPLAEIWCQYAVTIYDSLAKSYWGLPGEWKGLFGESGALAGGQTRFELEADLKRTRVPRPGHWPDPENYRDGDSSKTRRVVRRILVGKDVAFAYLLDEPWFMGQIRDCIAERVLDWKDRFAESQQSPTPRRPVQQHPVPEPNAADGNPPRRTAKGATRVTHPARPEIEKFATDAFAVARDRIGGEYEEKKKSVLTQVRRTGNSGGYLPALIKCEAEHVRVMVLARADAYVVAFTLYGVPSDRQAEHDLQTAAQQMAGGSISGIRGDLQKRSVRSRIPEEGQGTPWHLEIERAMHAAVNEGKLRLQRQRIKAKAARTRPAPAPGRPSFPIPAGRQTGMANDSVAGSPNLTRIGDIMERLASGQDFVELSPESLREMATAQAAINRISSEAYARLLRKVGKMETSPAAFRDLLPSFFADLGLEIPPGVLTPQSSDPGPSSGEGGGASRPVTQLANPTLAKGTPDKGNLDILRGTDGKPKRVVTVADACRYGGVGQRAIQKACKKGSLESEGEGPNRRIIVQSLINYYPPENNAN